MTRGIARSGSWTGPLRGMAAFDDDRSSRTRLPRHVMPIGAVVSIDRLPPQSIEAEQSVLGALPHRPRRGHRGRRLLRPEDFYRGHHGTIYGAILDLYERREPVDIVTGSEVLERQGRSTRSGAPPT